MALSDYKKVLVTGASSGIGREAVRRLCDEELEVHALARRSARLDTLSTETGCAVVTSDLQDNGH